MSLDCSQCVQLRRAETDSNVWVNDNCGTACRSPSTSTVREEPQAHISDDNGSVENQGPEGAKSPGSSSQILSGDRASCKEDESQWRWRALQGGASVVRNLRKGWAQACNATLDVAAAAAELLDKSGMPPGGVEAPSARPRDAPGGAAQQRCESPPSPLLMPRPARGDSFASVGSDWEDCAVLVEHEHEPWQTRPPVSLAEWNAWFDSEGRLQVVVSWAVNVHFGLPPPLLDCVIDSVHVIQAQGMDCLRRAAYYGGLSPQVEFT